jgi:hypothetical protein
MPSEGRKDRLGGQRPVPSTTPGFVPLWAGRGAQKHSFLLLNPRVYGLATHWDGERILPCTHQLGVCLPCRLGWEARWRGFLGGASCQTKGRYLLQITALAWNLCDALKEHDGELRGRYLCLFRLGDKRQAPWRCEWPSFRAIEPPFPPLDLPLILGRLWQIDLARLAECEDFSGNLRPFTKEFKGSKGQKR